MSDSNQVRKPMLRPAAVLRRSLVFVHRWLGVALSVVFLLWFLSGIVMMYWTFPDVTPEDRLQRAPVLDPTTIKVSPEDAYAAIGRDQSPRVVCLNSFDGRPVYRFDGGCGGGAAMVYADDGTVPRVDEAMSDRAAAAWTGLPAREALKESVGEVDQWTVGELRTVRPLYKYAWPDGQQVYVNGSTAEVAQYTTAASRFWAYLGAIPHWLYFTPLRKHPPEWFSFVVWSSLIGTVATLMGVVIAVWMYSPRKRYRHAGAPTSVPYRGWKRWHMITGLFFGVVTTTWAFSGLLSMGPFPLMNRLTALAVRAESPPADGAVDPGVQGEAPDMSGVLRGGGEFRLSSYSAKPASVAIASVRNFEVKELEYTSFGGRSVYLASNGRGDTRVIPITGAATTTFDIDEIERVVREAAGSSLAELRVMEEYDAYYLDRRRERPLPVLYVRMNDAASTRYYIDPKTARVVGTYDAREWVNRWLYHGLHSLDFPWLYRYRPLWDIVVITLMLGGTAICVTSLVLTWRVLARTLVAFTPVRLSPPNEDLALDVKS